MKIEVAARKGDSTKKKGDLLENLAKDFLETQNYVVDTEIRNTGTELDLLCKNKANQSKVVYIECKAYDEGSKISAEVIHKLYGIRGIKKYQEAWLICTTSLSKDAKGLVLDIEGGDDSSNFTFYTPEKLIQALVGSRYICDSKVALQKVIDLIKEHNRIKETVLLITEYGYFWAFEYLKAGVPYGTIITYAKNGDVVTENDLLINLKNTESSLKGLDFLQILNLDKKDETGLVEITTAGLKLNKDYLNELNEIGVQIMHPAKEELNLSDIFVYPDFEDIENENEILSSKYLLDKSKKLDKCVVFGGDVSGKTSLAHMIQNKLNQQDYVTIYLNAENIKNSSWEKLSNLLLAQFKNQYLNSDKYTEYFKNLLEHDRSDIYLVIDDFELLSIKNNKARISFLEILREKFEHVLIFSGKSLEIETMADSGLKDCLKYFKTFRIKQLGHVLRDELIDKWLSLGAGENFSETELYNAKFEIASKINFAVGNNFVPTYPLYILMMLQLIDEGSKLKLQGSSYAELYSYLINQSLCSVNTKAEDLDLFHTYLAHLAFIFYKKNIREMSKAEMTIMYNEYCEKMDIDKKFKSVHSILIKAKIIRNEGDFYKFNHNYSYYYFCAKYLSDNISDAEVLRDVDNIIEKIYKTDFANIVIFFIHHSKNNNIIDKILGKSVDLFSDKNAYTLSADEINSINSLIHEEIKMSIEDRDVKDNRLNDLEKMDQIENKKIDKGSNDSPDESGGEQVNLFNKINLSFKLMEILGQIATSYYGSINAERKGLILDEICALGLRSLRALLENFQSYLDGVRDEIGEMLEREKGFDFKRKQEVSDKIIYGFQEMIVFAFLKKISDSIASKNLFKSTDKIPERNNTPANKIISTAVRMNFPNEFSPEKVLTLNKEFSDNYLAKRLLKILTVEHFYKFEVKYDIKQKVCQKMDIKIRNKLIV